MIVDFFARVTNITSAKIEMTTAIGRRSGNGVGVMMRSVNSEPSFTYSIFPPIIVRYTSRSFNSSAWTSRGESERTIRSANFTHTHTAERVQKLCHGYDNTVN